MEYYSGIKKNEIMWSAATWWTRDYYTKWSKSDKERQASYNITYKWNFKNDMKKFIYKTE